jgi:hypothetical protein
MQVLCDCGGECVPSFDTGGGPEYVFPIASITMMGLLRYELRALWFLCPNCEKSFMVLPYTSPVENQKAVFIMEE